MVNHRIYSRDAAQERRAIETRDVGRGACGFGVWKRRKPPAIRCRGLSSSNAVGNPCFFVIVRRLVYSLASFFAFATASSAEPTYMKACSGRVSCLPSQISSKLRIVSSSCV